MKITVITLIMLIGICNAEDPASVTGNDYMADYPEWIKGLVVKSELVAPEWSYKNVYLFSGFKVDVYQDFKAEIASTVWAHRTFTPQNLPPDRVQVTVYYDSKHWETWPGWQLRWLPKNSAP